ncbi:MAG: sulfatase-like hydrolase/transferase [Pyrinomonadaceae bacterium]|nr:sulfatase-like hydrolase/transferase [Pyrinomonadaceae bacterium]
MIVFIHLSLPVIAHGQTNNRAKTDKRRPNIIIIMADDLGFSDLGSYGSEIKTPNLDRLARDGMRFTQFYNAGRCCPSRAALLTGLYPQQTGVGWMVDQTVQPRGYQRALTQTCVTIAEALRPVGYHTLMSGKWHIGEQRPHLPIDRGFERSFALVNALSNYFGVYGSYPTNEAVTGPMRRIESIERAGIWVRDGEPYTPPADGSFYSTEAITETAVGYLDEYARKKELFLLYVAYPAPHWPLHALPEDISKYRDTYHNGWDAVRAARHQRLIDLGLIDARWTLTPRDERVPAWSQVENLAAWHPSLRVVRRTDGLPEWDAANDRERWTLKMVTYAAQVDRMDQGIGRIMRKLKETGADDNTLILFLSDNGADQYSVDRGVPNVPPGSKESFLSAGPPWANVSNAPFRNYKAHIYEAGIATPFIARYPAVIKGGTITGQPGHIIDIMATILAGLYPIMLHSRAYLSGARTMSAVLL